MKTKYKIISLFGWSKRFWLGWVCTSSNFAKVIWQHPKDDLIVLVKNGTVSRSGYLHQPLNINITSSYFYNQSTYIKKGAQTIHHFIDINVCWVVLYKSITITLHECDDHPLKIM
jgi:hypothetical protein